MPPEAPEPKIQRQSTDLVVRNKESALLSTEGDVQRPGRVAICRVDQVFSKKDHKTHLVKSARKSDGGKFSKYALVVRRIFNYKHELDGIEIDIRGPHLRDVLLEMYPDTEGTTLAENPPVATPDLLYHSYSELQTRLDQAESDVNTNEDLVFELTAALDFVKTDYGDKFLKLESLFAKGEITFEFLWALYRPCEPVFHIDGVGEARVYTAKTHRVVKESDGKHYYEILGDYLDSDGKNIGLAPMRRVLIPLFKGAKPITSLQLYPLRYHPNRENLRVSLIKRGRMGLNMQGCQLKSYSGHAYKEMRQENRYDIFGQRKEPEFERFNAHGRVIVDPRVFASIEAANNIIPRIYKVYEREDLTDDLILTYSSMLYGFSLGDKLWGGFVIDRLKDISWNSGIFESLVMAEPQKSLVRTLVEVHRSTQHEFDDFVAEKGKGLIGLLTGPPGVGKTLTAEAVAEVSQRPLYTIISAELGDEPSLISANIAKILEVCQTWNAVLLLDEADVFLTKRDDTNLERNAIVSIFLRQIEYYQGILLLTTNCVDSIDDAILSRIHFRHDYPDLNKKARFKIWKSFRDLVNSKNAVSMNLSDEDLEELAEHTLNGRQIKNTISIAQTIASARKNRTLDVAQVQEIILLFQGSIKKTGLSS